MFNLWYSHNMRLAVQLQLQPTPEQADLLKQTLEAANAACNQISQVAWDLRSFKQFDIHRLTYHDIREQTGLSAQLVVRCIAKVADGYKLDKQTQRVFKPLGAVAFDERILSYKQSSVSIWTVGGRQTIPFVCGPRQRELLDRRVGESDLACVKGRWYLIPTAEVEEPSPIDVEGVLGIDLGIANIATDSDGETHTGAVVERIRKRRTGRRAAGQAVGTKSAKRRLKQLAGRQRRFQANENHRISKQVVAKAKHTKRAIALEELSGIRTRVRVRGTEQRARHSNWAFSQLRLFISYKAKLRGVPVEMIDPAYTSRTCAVCGCQDKCNRKTQALFCCISCGHSAPADWNAAVNIRERAAVNQPMASNLRIEAQAHEL